MGILLKGQPNNVQALYLRGKSYFYMDDQSMAKRHFGEALKYDPEHKEAKAEFSKVRTLYKKKAQVSQPLPCWVACTGVMLTCSYKQSTCCC